MNIQQILTSVLGRVAPIHASDQFETEALHQALLANHPKPPKGLQGDALKAWCLEADPRYGTAQAYLHDRNELCALQRFVLQLRKYGPLRDDEMFTRALGMMHNKQGRTDFLNEAIERDYHASALAQASDEFRDVPMRTRPSFAVPPEDISSFAIGVVRGEARDASLPKVLSWFDELQDQGLKDHLGLEYRRGRVEVYSFTWGRAIATKTEALLLATPLRLHPQVDLVRQRILNDVMLFAMPHLWDFAAKLGMKQFPTVQVYTGNERTPVIHFELRSGSSAIDMDHASKVLREWLAHAFVADILPKLVTRVLDMSFEYPIEAMTWVPIAEAA
jgi:hypothetical protein